MWGFTELTFLLLNLFRISEGYLNLVLTDQESTGNPKNKQKDCLKRRNEARTSMHIQLILFSRMRTVIDWPSLVSPALSRVSRVESLISCPTSCALSPAWSIVLPAASRASWVLAPMSRPTSFTVFSASPTASDTIWPKFLLFLLASDFTPSANLSMLSLPDSSTAARTRHWWRLLGAEERTFLLWVRRAPQRAELELEKLAAVMDVRLHVACMVMVAAVAIVAISEDGKVAYCERRSPVYMTDADRSESHRLTRYGTLSDIAAKLSRNWTIAVILEAGHYERNSGTTLCKRQVQKVNRIFRQIGYGT